MLDAAATWTAGRDAAHHARLHRGRGLNATPHATLVTLDCTPFDIAMSVSEAGAAVYSPAVLHLWGQSRKQSRDVTLSDGAE